MKKVIRKLLRSLGYDLVGWNGHNDAYRRMMTYSTIDHLLDVGANTGQFALSMRNLGFRGIITSFEPLKSAFAQCSHHAARDSLWTVRNFALGSEESEIEINIADNSQSSSLLAKKEAEKDFQYVGGELVTVKPLDAIFDDICPSGQKVGLKIDTQGYERRVLEGASRSLQKIDIVQLECPFGKQSYEGVWGAAELLLYMEGLGFVPASFEPGNLDSRTGRLHEVDIIFVRDVRR